MKKKDCINYSCVQFMGASIDCCILKGFGNCPCSNDCKDYANKDEAFRLGLEVLKQRNEAIISELDGTSIDDSRTLPPSSRSGRR